MLGLRPLLQSGLGIASLVLGLGGHEFGSQEAMHETTRFLPTSVEEDGPDERLEGIAERTFGLDDSEAPPHEEVIDETETTGRLSQGTTRDEARPEPREGSFRSGRATLMEDEGDREPEDRIAQEFEPFIVFPPVARVREGTFEERGITEAITEPCLERLQGRGSGRDVPHRCGRRIGTVAWKCIQNPMLPR